MKLYTKAGDQGQTQIIGNEVRYKSDQRVEAYGTIDELNSLMGMVAAQIENQPERVAEIQQIQNYLFDCGTDTSAVDGTLPYRTEESWVEWLEGRIDAYNDIPPQITEFVLPGGSPLASLIHYARTVARRAEREVVAFQQVETSNPVVLRFLNRLSDYLFILARVTNYEAEVSETFYVRSGQVFR